MKPLATIGYEHATQDDVIARLTTAKVEVVVDVRAVASSRRAGFSKTVLAASLADAGIDYVHLRDLGTPKPGRDAVRHGRVHEMEAIYAEHMKEPAAQLQLAEAIAIARDRKAALLCYEADPAHCHRTILAQRICAATGCRIENL